MRVMTQYISKWEQSWEKRLNKTVLLHFVYAMSFSATYELRLKEIFLTCSLNCQICVSVSTFYTSGNGNFLFDIISKIFLSLLLSSKLSHAKFLKARFLLTERNPTRRLISVGCLAADVIREQPETKNTMASCEGNRHLTLKTFNHIFMIIFFSVSSCFIYAVCSRFKKFSSRFSFFLSSNKLSVLRVALIMTHECWIVRMLMST